MNAESLADRIEAALGRRPERLDRIGARVWRLNVGREILIAKAAPSHLASESRMLADLAAAGAPVPRVHYGDDRLIVMDHVETDGAGLSDGGARVLAETLAALHANTAPEYGHGYDVMIGDLPQINERFASWIDFFRWKRLDVAAWLAMRRGHISPDLNERLWRLGERLRDWLHEPPRPALLHGDLRIANVLCRGGKAVALIDPAIAYGHPEIELASSQLLGGFRPGFLRHYLDIAPPPPGFAETRCALYQLYPLLVREPLVGERIEVIVSLFESQ
ncbi:MAG: fructosamine kinase family protein [Alphaproteobacteria bacterium]|nr:fructosamine kinase family protein [Alphaproteobacteria bacterium]